MGRLFLVELEQEGPRNAFCSACGTHIASSEDFQLESEITGTIYSKGMNVEVDLPDKYWFDGPHKVADIFCVKCGQRLGFKYIRGGVEERFLDNMVKLAVGKTTRQRR